MRYIRYITTMEEVVSAIVTPNSEVYNLPLNNYVEFYYELKSRNISIDKYIEEEGLVPLENKKLEDLKLILPISSDEVWASGVTYLKSKDARNYEATQGKLNQETFYDKVYDAERPEIFMKSTARRLVGPSDEIYIRRDSDWQIPEPELTLIIGEKDEIIGYTLGNDMSCRDIEGENPLYLPQAKIWRNSCSIGPAILLPESIEDPYSIDITCRIYRDDRLIFEGSAFVNQLKRKLDELVRYLVFDNDILPGTALMTGTCIVPPNDFSLQTGDQVEIYSSKIGSLWNTVNQN